MMRLALKTPHVILSLVLFLACLSLSAGGGPQQAADQKVEGQHRVLGVYALGKNGAPATGLTAGDLEVALGGRKIDGFTLTKGGSSKKLIFLVFDCATSPYNMLSRSKKIAEAVIARTEGQAHFVVMSISPSAGLQTNAGPTDDRQAVVDDITKLISSKKGEYIQSRSVDGSGIRDAYPYSEDPRRFTTPELYNQPGASSDKQRDKDLSKLVLGSLTGLGDILGRFPQAIKIVHLYSSGLPTSATEDQLTIQSPNANAPTLTVTSPDSWAYNRVKAIGQSIKSAGALLLLINPAGVRVTETSDDSGTSSLHLLATESNGVYFSGTDKDITTALEAEEQGYYEVSLTVPPDLAGQPTAVDIRPKNPEIGIFGAASLTPTKPFRELTPQERQDVVLNIVSGGAVGDVDLQISQVAVEFKPAGDQVVLTLQLPPELAQSEWDIYKVWRDRSAGKAEVEREHVLSESPILQFGMTNRQGRLQDAVLVQVKTGTVLVCQGQATPKK